MFDYIGSDFKVVDEDGEKKYFVKVKREYVEVTKAVYKILYNSYRKQLYDYRRKVALSISNYENIDDASFFVTKKEKDIIEQIVLNDLVELVKLEISAMTILDQEIITSILFFNESERFVAKKLSIPQRTLHDHKVKCLKQLRIKIKSVIKGN